MNDLTSSGEYDKKALLSGDRCHRITQFSGSVYKITQWYGFPPSPVRGARSPSEHSDIKLSQSISRTRRVLLELALCNDWEWFCTFTLDEEKRNRFDLEGWHKQFSQWIKDLNKTKTQKLRYVIVPEQHSDGAWHAHGFISGIDRLDLVPFSGMDSAGYVSSNGKRLPRDLVKGDYCTWWPYWKKFGFCSIGRINNHDAASFYITKYITKDQVSCVSKVGSHMYWCSRGLNRPQVFGEFYGRHSAVDSFLTNNYEFCRTGFVLSDVGMTSDNMALMVELMDGWFPESAKACDLFPARDPELISPGELEADHLYEYEQLALNYVC